MGCSWRLHHKMISWDSRQILCRRGLRHSLPGVTIKNNEGLTLLGIIYVAHIFDDFCDDLTCFLSTNRTRIHGFLSHRQNYLLKHSSTLRQRVATMGAISAVFLILITIFCQSQTPPDRIMQSKTNVVTVPPIGVWAVAGCGMGMQHISIWLHSYANFLRSVH